MVLKTVNIKLVTGIHQQNKSRFECHMKTSATLQTITAVPRNSSKYSQAPLELCKVLSDSTTAFSGAPYRIVQYWRSWELSTDLRETSIAAETTVQVCRRLGAVNWQQWFVRFHNHKAFCLSYSSLLPLQDVLHHNMTCIIYRSDFKYIHTVNLPAEDAQAWSEKPL